MGKITLAEQNAVLPRDESTPPLFLLTDEAALVKGARKLGFVFTARTPYSVIIEAVSDSPRCRRMVLVTCFLEGCLLDIVTPVVTRRAGCL